MYVHEALCGSCLFCLYVHEAVWILSLPIISRPLQNKTLKMENKNATSHWVGCLKCWYDISSPPHNQMVVPPNDLQKMVGIAVSVVIGCLHFDKRK
jgi:hypothetical protein